jgi:hypothetical protein
VSVRRQIAVFSRVPQSGHATRPSENKPSEIGQHQIDHTRRPQLPSQADTAANIKHLDYPRASRPPDPPTPRGTCLHTHDIPCIEPGPSPTQQRTWVPHSCAALPAHGWEGKTPALPRPGGKTRLLLNAPGAPSSTHGSIVRQGGVSSAARPLCRTPNG